MRLTQKFRSVSKNSLFRNLTLLLFFSLSSFAAMEDFSKETYRRVLSIGGSDSGGGAGIQADLKTFSALGCFGTTALTLITVQNTQGVSDVVPVDSKIINGQINAVMDDIGTDVIKIGALGTTENVSMVAKTLRAQKEKGFIGKIVLDPVLISKGGNSLVVHDEARFVETMVRELFPLVDVITPNRHEASRFLQGREFRNKQDVEQRAIELLQSGAKAVVVKGCGFDEMTSEDCLMTSEGHPAVWLTDIKLPIANLHGTGCTFSAAIAAYLAHSFDIATSVREGKKFLTTALESSDRYRCGKGINPVNHLCGMEMPWTRFCDVWEEVRPDFLSILRAPFNRSIADNSVSRDQFFFYLHQDYIFLKKRDELYEHIHRGLVERSFPLEDQEYMKKKLSGPKDEKHKRTFFAKYESLDHPTEFSATFWDTLSFEAPSTQEYVHFLEREGKELLEESLAAVLPCAVIYQELGEFIKRGQSSEDVRHNKYQKWIDTYSSPLRRKSINDFIQLTDRVAERASFNRRISMRRIFKEGVRQELLFCRGIAEFFGKIPK